MTLPNAITLSRLALVPVILALSYARRPGPLGVAAGLFAVAVASDWLDGYLARRLRAFSRFGTLLDPVVDKILILGIFFVFTARGLLPGWIFLLNMARELIVSAVRHAGSDEREVVGANWMGKTKFCLQTGLAALLYVHALCAATAGRALPHGDAVVFWFAVGMTALSYAFLIVFIRSQLGRLAKSAST